MQQDLIWENWRNSLVQCMGGRSLPTSYSRSKETNEISFASVEVYTNTLLIKPFFQIQKWMLKMRLPRVGFCTELFYLIYVICNCKSNFRGGYQPFLCMSNDNNFNVENWLQVSSLGHSISCNLQCNNISAQFHERRKLWSYLNFLQQQTQCLARMLCEY